MTVVVVCLYVCCVYKYEHITWYMSEIKGQLLEVSSLLPCVLGPQTQVVLLTCSVHFMAEPSHWTCMCFV